MIGFLLAAAVGAVASAGQDVSALREGTLRLHVIANSDLPADQTVKLAVRDAIVAETDALLSEEGVSSKAEAADCVARNAARLEQCADTVLREAGCSYQARVRITACDFPVRRYDTRLLPAGTYDAVRVELGDAAGKNWWCVLFPQLCLSAVTKDWSGLPAIADGENVSVRVALWDWLVGLLGKK